MSIHRRAVFTQQGQGTFSGRDRRAGLWRSRSARRLRSVDAKRSFYKAQAVLSGKVPMMASLQKRRADSPLRGFAGSVHHTAPSDQDTTTTSMIQGLPDAVCGHRPALWAPPRPRSERRGATFRRFSASSTHLSQRRQGVFPGQPQTAAPHGNLDVPDYMFA